jgi:hypothetical protein
MHVVWLGLSTKKGALEALFLWTMKMNILSKKAIFNGVFIIFILKKNKIYPQKKHTYS